MAAKKKPAPSFPTRLHDALGAALPGRVKYLTGWRAQARGIGWRGKTGTPVALLVHHTAAAKTDSTDPKHPGNRTGANSGVVQYIAKSAAVPWANFVLDRDGTVYVVSAFPVWHAGRGSFTGVDPFERLGIPDDAGNDYMLGVEVVSKGAKRDWTDAQKASFAALAQACQAACGWPGFVMRLPNHRSWTSRKIDSRYTVEQLRAWAEADAS